MASRVKAGFVPPMLLLRSESLPDDLTRWSYQLKLDGYRAIAFKTGGSVHLRSRNDNDFTHRYPAVVRGLSKMPNETVLDGEVVALDDDGRPSFNALQNFTPGTLHRLLRLRRDGAGRPRRHGRARSRSGKRCWSGRSCRSLAEPVRYTGELNAGVRDLIHSVKTQGLEGLVAKRRTSKYEPGVRSGAWMKMRVNRGQEFVIAGYTVGTKTFDALIIGYYEGDRLIYAARTRNGFTPAHAQSVVQEVCATGDSRVPVRQSS